ncbi:MAG: iron-containing alcohol dehydrogenase [Bacteroidales bacterium]|jgi:NADP-dependent alcohol dehydrogenase|nr:iron-containing alcohol dehydrogenase [Bacteroidales bacterium]
MNNFEYKNPVKILFGKDQSEKVATEIPAKAKIMLLYGGGSIKKNGIYTQITKALNDFEVVEFGGIPANPEYEVLMQALEVVKEENVTFLLAVGGGSVIDGTKFLSAAAKYKGDNPWDILAKRQAIPEAMPFGTVLTMPATGSEMNSGFVLTRRATKEKLASGAPVLFPQFSVLDPQVVSSIPQGQIANGLADAFTHVIEQYLTYPNQSLLQDRFAESILHTIVEVAPVILKDPTDYDAAANYMWCCTMALNGLIGQGVPQDWAIHMMGHELTALFGIDHARTLAIVAPSHYRYNFDSKRVKLAQYAERIWNVTEGNEEEKARTGIEKTEAFFHSLGIATQLSEYTKDFQGTANIIAKRFEERGWKLGEHAKLRPTDVEKIIEMAY